MNVTLKFPPELESVLRRCAAAAGQDVNPFVQKIVAENLDLKTETTAVNRVSSGKFVELLESWIALHPVLDHAVDDSRESIYSGCGE